MVALCRPRAAARGGTELIELNTNTKVVFHTSAKNTISSPNEAIRGRGEAIIELELAELNTNTRIVFRLIQGRTSPPPARGSRRLRID